MAGRKKQTPSDHLIGLKMKQGEILELLQRFPILEVTEASAKKTIRESGALDENDDVKVFEMLAWIYKSKIKRKGK